MREMCFRILLYGSGFEMAQCLPPAEDENLNPGDTGGRRSRSASTLNKPIKGVIDAGFCRYIVISEHGR